MIFEHGQTQFLFDSGAKDFALKSMKWRAQELLGKGRCRLWSLTVENGAGHRAKLGPRRADEWQFGVVKLGKGQGERFTIQWFCRTPDDSQVTVAVSVRLPEDSPLSYWSMSVDLTGSQYGLREVVFPDLSTLDGGGKQLTIPAGLGLVMEQPFKKEQLRLVYPGGMIMQFLALTGAGGGLYLGAHDPAAHHKEFVFEPDGKRSRVCLKIETPPAGMGPELKTWRMPYEAVIAAFDGDWYDATSIYRDWTLNCAPWNQKRKQSLQRRIPKKLRDTDFWILGSGAAEEAVPNARRMREFFGVNSAVHWYNWHQIPFDDQYPEYFPTKEGFTEGVAQLKRDGFLVMPYINGRLWDPKTESWQKEQATRSAIRKEDGRHPEEIYPSEVPLVAMCPHTALWHKKIESLVRRLITECGVSGVYIDQIGIARAYPCFAEDHGHPRGGGNFWWRGYAKLLQRCRRVLGPQNFLTTEEACESWNDLLDAFLMANTAREGFRLAPIYAAVYGGQTLHFGFQYLRREDAERELPWRARMGRNFLWGGQLGWVGDWILDKELRREAAFLRDLARCRQKVRPFFNRGRMLRPPQIEGVPMLDMPPERPSRKKGTKFPALMASAWKLGSALMVALVNFSDKPATARLSLPRPEYGLSRKGAYEMTCITAKDEQPLGVVSSDPLALKRRVPARRAAVLVLKKAAH